jgi:hypothetical protein
MTADILKNVDKLLGHAYKVWLTAMPDKWQHLNPTEASQAIDFFAPETAMVEQKIIPDLCFSGPPSRKFSKQKFRSQVDQEAQFCVLEI